MTGLEVLAVVGCVAALCSAYHDGAELVQHIKAKRKARLALKKGSQVDETSQELELSLNRGEGIIRSQYDRDFKRFGDSFACGDQAARDALKDIIIHLQQQVISNLKIHWQQDTYVDFTALQDVSDSSQDRCILVLMQLQQRIITSGPVENLAPPPLSSTSAFNQRSLPAIPSDLPHASPQAPTSRKRTGSLSTSPDQYEQGFAFTAPPSRQNTVPLTPPHSPYPTSGPFAQSPATQHLSPIQTHTNQNPSAASYAQSSVTQHLQPAAYSSTSTTPYAPSQALAPQYSLAQVPPNQFSPAQASAGQFSQLPPFAPPPASHFYTPQAPSVQHFQISPHLAQAQAVHQQDSSKASQDCRSPENRNESSQSQYKPIATTTAKVGFFGIRKKKIEKVVEPPENPLVDQYLAAVKEDEQRGTPRADSITASISTSPSSVYEPDHPNFNPWQDDSNSKISLEKTTTKEESTHAKPLEKVKNSLDSLVRAPVNQSTAHLEVLSSNRSLNSINPKDLLPGEFNNFAGFCKGAWRQQIGDRKKAVEERVRPGGMYNAARFLQCRSCKFEGRFVPPNKKQHGFDMRVFKLVEGIQFRWEFLFKSHLVTKDAVQDPTKGTFGCMFCCAEGKGTPTFDGVTLFMQHLVEHRDRLPTGEVLYRMNCLVGRQAGLDEDFDINIGSKEGGSF